MGYRGQDLDLRTPQTWRAAPTDLEDTGQFLNGPRTRSGFASDEVPIWVDETLLACCNHAFDVALAHRAAEVRVEHLLHALTRIEDAAQILEAAGINAASLRRETATIIASEIPVALTNGSASPRRADGFEEALRLAAAHAYQRHAPAGVEDLLHVLIEMRPQVAGVELVERHLAKARRVHTERPYRQAMPSFSSQQVRDTPRERLRRPSGRFFVNEPLPPPAPSPSRDVQRATDNLQNSRLDALEQMIRQVASQVTSQRDESSHFSGGVFDRLQTLESLLASRPDEGSDLAETLLRRIDSLERLVRERASLDLSGLERRIDELERTVREARPGGDLELTLTAVDRRLEEIERAVREVPDADLSQIERRIGEVETQLDGSIAERFAAFEAKADPSPILSRLETIETALLGADRAMAGDLDGRIAQLADAAAFHQRTLEDARLALASEIATVAANLNDQSYRLAETGQGIAQLINALEGQRAEDRAELADLRQRLETYESKVGDLQIRSTDVLAAYGEALSAHQQSVDAFAAHSNQSWETHNEELRQVHDALVKLNANQHTLAGSIDQWRSDGASDLAVISARMQALEREAGRPMALLETISTNMENMHRVTVERYHRRNRFWYWLFGTDDWVAASWPSQMEKIEQERRELGLKLR